MLLPSYCWNNNFCLNEIFLIIKSVRWLAGHKFAIGMPITAQNTAKVNVIFALFMMIMLYNR